MKTKKLRIAQIGTIWEKTPPKLYGGTERVVHDLTEQLVDRGHKVTLFATGDSITSAKLDSSTPKALYRTGVPWSNFLYPLYHISRVFERAREFDVIHMHINQRQDYVSLPMAGLVKTPTIFTLHFELPLKSDKSKEDRYKLLSKYRHRHFVSISHAQRTLKFLNYAGTVHNGLDLDHYQEGAGGDYVVWLGRICHDKGTREAIEAAKKSGTPIILAGRIDLFNPEYVKYYKTKIEPLIDGRRVKYIGEVDDKQKQALFAKAKALLHPINWNEPFGLAVIEAMAVGTPVIAFNRGPVREQIMNGKTGFIVKNVAEMAEAIKKVDSINRDFVREQVFKNFSSAKMAEGYEKIYHQVTKK